MELKMGYYHIKTAQGELIIRKEIVEKIRKETVFEISAEQDDIPVMGNAIASGNKVLDAEIENHIINRLEQGDIWAWASVCVKAKHGRFEGADYLGGCSYDDEASFKQDGYYDGMCDAAFENMLQEMVNTRKELARTFSPGKERIEIIKSTE